MADETETIASIQAEIDKLYKDKANVEAQKQSQILRRADWLRNYRGPGHSADADAALADVANYLAYADSWLSDYPSKLAALQDRMARAIKAKEDMDAALADATRKGLTGDAAIKHAEGQVAIDKAKSMAVIVAVVVVGLIGALWAWRKFKKA